MYQGSECVAMGVSVEGEADIYKEGEAMRISGHDAD